MGGRWVVLVAGTLAVFAALGLARFGYTVVLPAMQVGLQLDNAQAGALASFNLGGYLAMALVGGALASRFGPRLVICGGLLVVAGGMCLTGTADSFYTAALWRFVTGLGSGAANVAVMGMWSLWFPPEKRGFAAGIAVTGSSFALILVGPLVPQVMARFGADGWRSCWQIYGALSLAVALLCWLAVRNGAPAKKISLATPYAASEAAVNPSWYRRVYSSVEVWQLGLVYVANGFSYIIFMTFFIKHLMAAGGYTRAEAGTLFMVMGWASLGCGVIWGTVSDRFGRRPALAIVYLLHAGAFATFGLAGSLWGFIPALVLFGLSAWSIPAIMAATCGDLLGAELASAALGFITLFFGVGQAAGPWVAGFIADRYGSFTPAFLLAAAVALLGAAGSASLHKRSVRQ